MRAALPDSKTGLIPFEDALRIVRENAVLLGVERVPLAACLGRVLREDAASDMAMPPFDKSAMDGFACRRPDLPGPLEVLETIPAGRRPSRKVGKGQCSKIMTGAMLPKGADCVIMVEETETLPDGRVLLRPPPASGEPALPPSWRRRPSGTAVLSRQGRRSLAASNICRKGEDVSPGRKLVLAGTRVTPKVVSSLALAGSVEPLVSKRPVVGVLATGDEIVDPGTRPHGAHIRDTNSLQALAQARAFGCQARSYGIVPDQSAAIAAAIGKASAACDVLLITGGVSMGDFDLVPGELRKAGFRLLFEKVAVQPGKPTVFGRQGETFVFGMPGNPVSSFIVFEFFVKELLAGMMGLTEKPAALRCPLARDFTRRKAGRLARVPVRLTPDGRAKAVEYHGSAHITSLAGADGVISLPAGVATIKKGAAVEVRLF